MCVCLSADSALPVVSGLSDLFRLSVTTRMWQLWPSELLFCDRHTHDSLCPSPQGFEDLVAYLTAKNGQMGNMWRGTQGGMDKQVMFTAIFLCRQMGENIYNTAKKFCVSFSLITVNQGLPDYSGNHLHHNQSFSIDQYQFWSYMSAKRL